ncbi:very short patch repair endonuclease [Marivirga arenosa]|jgi:DNA mismatch endonuclease (patch repair protein)|uniref:Very short patch repair endonuclease n=1 Tax=Marivirga arenosa TaxID=3059076 RepID=A0AA49GLG5_9BACT|nr:very short patch repair endonuclease [Marivirga sp. ABR2-2]WKK86612.1 very short patch repair endonuclease [Marivirga sp. ABR2-2]
MDVLTPEQRTKNMKAIKSKNTKMEVKLAKELWAKGYRFRRNSKHIFGKPDFSLKKYKVAIFVDSEYFHGKDWATEKYRINTNRNFWWTKIEGNIERDKKVNCHLRQNGWKVLRFWTGDIKKNIDLCLLIIEQQLKEL